LQSVEFVSYEKVNRKAKAGKAMWRHACFIQHPFNNNNNNNNNNNIIIIIIMIKYVFISQL